MAREYRYKKKTSARSGFDYLENELVSDKGSRVGPDEYDTPPPSDLPLGGEGDSSVPTDARTDYTSYSVRTEDQTQVQYVTSNSTITWTAYFDKSGDRNYNKAVFYVCGSNENVTLALNQKITKGSEGDKLTLYGVGSSVTLTDGSGLSLRKTITLDSGAMINFFYSTGGNLWYETSRSHETKSLGEL